MYKLIAIDIDGTLVDSEGKISEANKNSIQKAINNKTEIVLTSGRIPQAIFAIAEETKANNYLIAGNGAVVLDIKNKQTIYNQYLSKKKMMEIINQCETNNTFYSIYLENKIVAERLDYNLSFYDSANKKLPQEKKINIEIKNNIVNFVKEYKKQDFLKITICEQNKIAFDRIMNSLKQINGINILEMKQRTIKTIIEEKDRQIAYYYAEIMNEKVDKWSALEFLLKKMKIDKQNVLAIGDNMNDERMLKNANIGVAMGNSYQGLKDIANYVVSDNNSNGVAEAIEKYY